MYTRRELGKLALAALPAAQVLGPGAVFTNDASPRAPYPKGPAGWRPTLVRRGATVGANATVLSGLTIGCWAMVGAGSVVTKDVPPGAIVAGNPARFIKWIPELRKSGAPAEKLSA